ncbi:hypothetical protein HaLaN_28612, partial [Haematococcus lacustris]
MAKGASDFLTWPLDVTLLNAKVTHQAVVNLASVLQEVVLLLEELAAQHDCHKVSLQ